MVPGEALPPGTYFSGRSFKTNHTRGWQTSKEGTAGEAAGDGRGVLQDGLKGPLWMALWKQDLCDHQDPVIGRSGEHVEGGRAGRTGDRGGARWLQEAAADVRKEALGEMASGLPTDPYRVRPYQP